MNTYEFKYDVHIFDTDCYGVVWHGSYAKWLEMGRVDFFKQVLALDLKALFHEHDVVVPVVEQNVKFKNMGRFGDRVKLVTRVEAHPPRIDFLQDIYDDESGKQLIEAKTTCVLISNSGKLYRQFPEVVAIPLKQLEATQTV